MLRHRPGHVLHTLMVGLTPEPVSCHWPGEDVVLGRGPMKRTLTGLALTCSLTAVTETIWNHTEQETIASLWRSSIADACKIIGEACFEVSEYEHVIGGPKDHIDTKTFPFWLRDSRSHGLWDPYVHVVFFGLLSKGVFHSN